MEEPKTRYIGKLEKGTRDTGPLLNAIRNELDSISLQTKAGSAFSVEGKDLAALKNAHTGLVEKQPVHAVFQKDCEVSIVYFALNSPYHVSLTDVRRREFTIALTYEHIPHAENLQTLHFSLIPLGKLPPGHYRVQIGHKPYEQRFGRFGRSGPNGLFPNRVSGSFGFDGK